jgi:hypothetical protein
MPSLSLSSKVIAWFFGKTQEQIREAEPIFERHGFSLELALGGEIRIYKTRGEEKKLIIMIGETTTHWNIDIDTRPIEDIDRALFASLARDLATLTV